MRLIKSKKGDMEVTIKSLFAILIVLLVFFIFFVLIQNNAGFEYQKEKFSSYKDIQDFGLTLLGSPCISVGNFTGEWQRPWHAVLDYRKIDKLNNGNQEIGCVDNFGFLYTLIIKDINNGKSWVLGLNKEPEFKKATIGYSFVVSIKYNTSIPEIHSGRAILLAYTGEIPAFIGTIKKSCHFQKDESFRLNNDYSILYDNNEDVLKVGNYTFYPYFSCPVSSFRIPKGQHIIRLYYNKGSVRVVS